MTRDRCMRLPQADSQGREVSKVFRHLNSTSASLSCWEKIDGSLLSPFLRCSGLLSEAPALSGS